MDAANDFAAPENGNEFINGPAGSSPTILGIPTFPTPTLGVLIHTDFDAFDLKIGHYSGEKNRVSFGDTFSIAELGLPIKENAVTAILMKVMSIAMAIIISTKDIPLD